MESEFISVQLKLLKKLDETYNDRTPDLMPFVTDRLEEHLREFTEETLLEFIFASAKTSIVSPRGRLIEWAGERYFLSILDDALRDDTLVIRLAYARDRHVAQYPEVTQVTIDGFGTYRKIKVYLPEEIADQQERIMSLAHLIFSTGYAWLLTYVRRAIEQTQEEFVFALYAKLRRLFNARGLSELADRTWLAIISDEKGFYIADAIGTEVIISATKDHPIVTPHSPAKLTTEFITTLLPFEMMHSKAAVEQKKCIDVNLRDSKYLIDEEPYELAEELIMGTTAISIQPIVTEGKAFLHAVFPTEHKVQIQPIILSASGDLSEAFKLSRSRSQRIIKKLQSITRGSIPAAELGRLLGAASAEALKALYDL